MDLCNAGEMDSSFASLIKKARNKHPITSGLRKLQNYNWRILIHKFIFRFDHVNEVDCFLGKHTEVIRVVANLNGKITQKKFKKKIS